MNIDPRELHRFTPSRPDGVVCITLRRRPDGLADSELCGYPAGHPIHADPPNGDTPEDRSPYQDLRVLRGIVMGYIDTGDESYVIATAALDRLAAILRAMPVDRGLEAQVRVRVGVCGEPIEDEPEPCALRTGHRSEECLSANTIAWQKALGGPLPIEDLHTP